ncbi:MAG: hypothetical protein IPK83_05965 [Planctomycetes bacterium]|nr:hypothetical protein [Planctomycetota bacterium]
MDTHARCFRVAAALICAVVAAFPEWLSAGDPVCDYIISDVKTIYFGIEVPVPDPNHPVTAPTGHTDVDIPYQSCFWNLEISPDAGGQIPAEDVLLFAGTQARFTLATIPPAFEFIGAMPGETFWVLPQNQAAGVIFLGLSSETMTLDDRSRLCEWNPGDPRGGANVPAKWIRIELADVRAGRRLFFVVADDRSRSGCAVHVDFRRRHHRGRFVSRTGGFAHARELGFHEAGDL